VAALGAAGGFEALTRIGFAARGLMYVLIGWLALKSGRSEEGAGVLAYISSAGGRLVLGAMAAGFLAYGLWRAADAWLDSQGRGSDGKGLALRAGGLVSGFIHLTLAVFAFRHAIGAGGGGGGDSSEAGAQTALDLPGGWIALVLAAAALLAAGLFQIGRAWTLGFMKNLSVGASTHPWLCWLGRGGFLARGIVFSVMALFLFRAGMEERSSEAGGLGQALESLPPSLQTAVAAGLLLFGLFSFAEARYRRIEAPQALG
jgi:hypothetical protein